MKYYLIAGERSGDLHGGNLIKSLKHKDLNASFRGFGGEVMQSAGMQLDLHYRELAFMGFWEVLINLFKIQRYFRLAKNSIIANKPDVVILIDYGGFNLKIASFLKQNNIRCYYYITPKVWAWNQARAKKIKRLVDKMFVILPFEKDFYKKFNWEVDYVGNPVLDAVKCHKLEAIKVNNNGKPIVAFLPGSRLQEITSVAKIVYQVIKDNPEFHFVIARVDNIDQSVYQPFDILDNVEYLTGNTYELLSLANAAIVTSGTATLETALFNVPQIVIYKTSYISYLIGKAVIKVNYISLVNLIANKRVVTELIQDDLNPSRLDVELKSVLNDQMLRTAMLEDYDKLRKQLNIGSASENTADLIIKYLSEKH